MSEHFRKDPAEVLPSSKIAEKTHRKLKHGPPTVEFAQEETTYWVGLGGRTYTVVIRRHGNPEYLETDVFDEEGEIVPLDDEGVGGEAREAVDAVFQMEKNQGGR